MLETLWMRHLTQQEVQAERVDEADEVEDEPLPELLEVAQDMKRCMTTGGWLLD